MAFVSSDELPFALELPGSIGEVTRLLHELIRERSVLDVVCPEQGAIVVNLSVMGAFIVSDDPLVPDHANVLLPWPNTVTAQLPG